MEDEFVCYIMLLVMICLFYVIFFNFMNV